LPVFGFASKKKNIYIKIKIKNLASASSYFLTVSHHYKSLTISVRIFYKNYLVSLFYATHATYATYSFFYFFLQSEMASDCSGEFECYQRTHAAGRHAIFYFVYYFAFLLFFYLV
jgi:hypothetical protein